MTRPSHFKDYFPCFFFHAFFFFSVVVVVVSSVGKPSPLALLPSCIFHMYFSFYFIYSALLFSVFRLVVFFFVVSVLRQEKPNDERPHGMLRATRLCEEGVHMTMDQCFHRPLRLFTRASVYGTRRRCANVLRPCSARAAQAGEEATVKCFGLQCVPLTSD